MLALTVEEVMQAPVETIEPKASALAVARRLDSGQVGSLVVCKDGMPVGFVTDVDMTRCLANEFDPTETEVREFMSSPVVTAPAGTSIVEAATMLRDNTIKRLPIVDDADWLVGIVTTTDLSNFIPHLPRLKREMSEVEDRIQSNREDTTYTKSEWSYDYQGNAAEITVGDTSRFEKRFTESDIEQFVEISGDTNRLHLDDEYARASRFGERIVHGTLVAGLISATPRLPGLTIYLSQDLSFLRRFPSVTAPLPSVPSWKPWASENSG